MNDKIQKLLDSLPENLNILDAQVNIDIQLEYFELSKKVNKKFIEADIIDKSRLLYTEELSIENKKELLIQIASIEEPKAFRILENYEKSAENEMHDWSLLALQENKMLLQGKYLDEPQVFISTGLGGQNNLLRYFAVFFKKDESVLSKIQHKVVKNEIEVHFTGITHKIESLEFFDKYVTLTILLPINCDLRSNFELIIRECNIYGDFLDSRCILTNVKKLNEEEIYQIKTSNKNSK